MNPSRESEIRGRVKIANTLPDSAWWKLKSGLVGLKRFMPNRAILGGYGWIRHYEPVCSGCHVIDAGAVRACYGRRLK